MSRTVWAGRLLSGAIVLFLAMDAAIKVLRLPVAMEATTQLGYPASAVVTIGVMALVCLVLYVLPRTALLGAVLWTGYLGGAVATHVRAQSPLFSAVLFPVYVAVCLWAGLWLRDPRTRSVVSMAFGQGRP